MHHASSHHRVDSDDMAILLRRLGKSGGFVTVVSSGLLTALTVLTGVATARLLDVEDRGTYSSVLAAASVMSMIAASGNADALILSAQRRTSPQVANTLAWSFTLGVACLGSVPVVFYTLQFETIPVALLVMACLLPIVSSVGPIANYALVAREKYLRSAVLRISPVVVQILALAVIIILDRVSLDSVFFTSFTGSFAAMIIAIWFTQPWRTMTWRIQWVEVARFTHISLHTGISQIIRVISTRVDLIIVAAVLGAYDAGLYAIAASLTVAGTALTSNLAPLLLKKQRSESANFTTVASALSMLTALSIIFIGAPLLPFVYGDDYAEAVKLVPVLAIGMLAAFSLETLTRVLQQDQQERSGVIASTISFGCQTVSIVMLGSAFGVFGAAFGNLIGYTLGVVSLVILNKIYGGDPLLPRISPVSGLRYLLDFTVGQAKNNGKVK